MVPRTVSVDSNCARKTLSFQQIAQTNTKIVLHSLEPSCGMNYNLKDDKSLEKFVRNLDGYTTGVRKDSISNSVL